MSLYKPISPKDDFVFKRLFGTERNKDILIHFLNDMLELQGEDQIEEVGLLQTILHPESAYKKLGVVDVLCQDQKGTKYIIEMQVARGAGFEKRALFYASRVYGGQLPQGEEYEHLEPVVFIGITDFDLFPHIPEYVNTHEIVHRKSNTQTIKEIKLVFMELPKFTLSIDQLQTMTDKWAYFFKHGHELDLAQFPKVSGDDMIIHRACDELNQQFWTQDEREAYERVWKDRLDGKAALKAAEQKGEQRGEQRGREEGIIQVARGLLEQRQLNIQQIASVTRLDLEVIIGLQSREEVIMV